LQTGVSANEIIDTLFIAFPTLGLTKIVWAIDIILEMDIPEFKPQELSKPACWHDIDAVDNFNDKKVVYKNCEDRDLFIYRNNDNYKVYNSHCPHQVTKMTESALTDFELKCPRHGWKFDIQTGDCIENGDRPLKQYEIQIAIGRLSAYW